MTGAFSGHLIESYHTVPRNRLPFAPFGQELSSSHISMSGPLSWTPAMHGSFHSQPSFSVANDTSFMELSEATASKVAEMQAKLARKLGPEYISQRPGPGGGPKLTYAEGWKIINLANEVFGFNGWSSSVVNITVDFVDEHPETKRVNVGVTAIVRVTLRDGVFHEDVGYGILENSKSKGQALDKCKKEAVTDGIKRALRNFGNLLGNCLYDKEYAKEIVKIKVPPPKFDKSELHRRPEFAEPGEKNPIAGPSTSANTSYSSAKPDTSANLATCEASTSFVKAEPGTSAGQMRPPPAPPSHTRTMGGGQSDSHRPTAANRPAATSTPRGKGPVHAPPPPGMQSRSAQGGAPQDQKLPPTNAHPNAARATPNPLVNPPQRVLPAAAAPPQPATVPTPAPAPAHALAAALTDNVVDQETQEEFPLEEGEDSFSLYNLTSDDDAYLAAVDLTGIGGPVDHDGGTGVTEPEPALASATSAPAPPAFTRQSTGRSTSGRADRLSLITAAIDGTDADTSDSVGAKDASLGQTSTAPPAPVPPTSGHLGSTASRAPTRQPSLQRLNHASSPLGGSKPEQIPSTSRVAPSMGGGFNFPAGFTSQNQKGPAAPAAQGLTLKRNADMMQSGSVAPNVRRPAQGMGLAHQPASGGNGGRRDPLPNLPIGDGGDTKRVRR